jgi:hypothetical protein
VELHRTVHDRRHPLGHGGLLGTLRVRHRGLAGFEADHTDEHVVVGEAIGAAEPARGTGRNVSAPLIGKGVEFVLPSAPGLNDLDEHAIDATPAAGRRP